MELIWYQPLTSHGTGWENLAISTSAKKFHSKNSLNKLFTAGTPCTWTVRAFSHQVPREQPQTEPPKWKTEPMSENSPFLLQQHGGHNCHDFELFGHQSHQFWTSYPCNWNRHTMACHRRPTTRQPSCTLAPCPHHLPPMNCAKGLLVQWMEFQLCCCLKNDVDWTFEIFGEGCEKCGMNGAPVMPLHWSWSQLWVGGCGDPSFLSPLKIECWDFAQGCAKFGMDGAPAALSQFVDSSNLQSVPKMTRLELHVKSEKTTRQNRKWSSCCCVCLMFVFFNSSNNKNKLKTNKLRKKLSFCRKPAKVFRNPVFQQLFSSILVWSISFANTEHKRQQKSNDYF